MAGVKGLEPSAFAVTGRRCNQLNYTPALKSLGVNSIVDEQEVVEIPNKVNAVSQKTMSFFSILSVLKPKTQAPKKTQPLELN